MSMRSTTLKNTNPKSATCSASQCFSIEAGGLTLSFASILWCLSSAPIAFVHIL